MSRRRFRCVGSPGGDPGMLWSVGQWFGTPAAVGKGTLVGDSRRCTKALAERPKHPRITARRPDTSESPPGHPGMPEGSITLKTKPDRRGTPSPADHFYQLTGIPFPPVRRSSAMLNPRSMIHDLASTAHDSRSAPRSPICNLRCSVNSGVPGKTRGGTVVSFGIPA